MVVMGVRDQNMCHRFAFDRFQGRGNMRLVQRARIDNRDIAASNDVCAGAFIRKRAGVLGDDTADHGRNLIHFAIFKLDFCNEWYGHWHRGLLELDVNQKMCR